ncbi:MAG TPA: glycosyl hydrolase family 18 protein [Mucilaginibacter sp.]|jgi:GH18 family chitinase
MTNLNRILAAIILIALMSVTTNSSAQTKASVNKPVSNFRIIGYLRVSNISDGTVANVDLSKINYLNIAFINPDQDGNFSVPKGLSAVLRTAHAKNVKVLASMGGGLAPAYYSTLLLDERRNDFVNRIVKLASDNDFDGVDIDLEGDRIHTNYETFVTTLSAALKQKNKILTAAVATVYKLKYTDRALAQFDFINIMSYDKTGPWNLNNPGQHSPYEMAVSDLDYWTNTRGIAKEKLSLGVPFYGYGFGGNAPADMSFHGIIAQYPGAENMDQVAVRGGGIIYYNGIATIKNKTTLALQKCGGIMIWQLLQDASGNKSLLTLINDTVNHAKANK